MRELVHNLIQKFYPIAIVLSLNIKAINSLSF